VSTDDDESDDNEPELIDDTAELCMCLVMSLRPLY